MNAIVLNNVSVSTTSQQMIDLLNYEGVLIANNVVEFLNNLYSKTAMVQVKCWHDTEKAYNIIQNLRRNGETEIETKEGIFITKVVHQEEVKIYEPEMDYEPNPICEELDQYLENLRQEDECIWTRDYDKVSSDDEMNRDESYLYLDLRDLIGEEYVC